MNGSNFKKTAFISLSLVVVPAIANNQTIIGAQAAQHFHHKKNGHFYIQLASFSNKANASRFEKNIQRNTHKKVSVIQKNGHYIVRVGPLDSAEQVRKVGNTLDSNQTPSKPVHTPVHNPVHVTEPTYTPVTHHPEKEPLSTPVPNLQYGPYVGASVGPIINVSGSPYSYGGAEGTLSVGYSALKNDQYYIAAEFFGGDSLNVHNTYDHRTGAGVQTSWTYGVDLIPGLRMGPEGLFYLRGGFANTHFPNVNRTKTGWRAGLGGQLPICSTALNLRLEYVVAGYRRSHSTEPVPVGDVYTNQFNVGLLYQFDQSGTK